MHRAKRAIIMAAGYGSRLRPLTLTTPKPMVKVNGIRMIDTVIDGLHENGIDDIYIVVGYLKEVFAELSEKYENIHFIENPYYDVYNNISSLYSAREYLDECVIIDGDQIVYNKKILCPDFEKSCYCCTWSEEHTDEWLISLENGRTVSCSRTGGSRGWQLYGVSFWTKEDAGKLRADLEREFEQSNNNQIYWDDIALNVYPDRYDIGVRQIATGDIVEIDSIEDLRRVEDKLNCLER